MITYLVMIVLFLILFEFIIFFLLNKILKLNSIKEIISFSNDFHYTVISSFTVIFIILVFALDLSKSAIVYALVISVLLTSLFDSIMRKKHIKQSKAYLAPLINALFLVIIILIYASYVELI